ATGRRRRERAQALRSGAAAEELPHYRARAPSRHLSAGNANAGRESPRWAAQHRRRGDRGNRGAGFSLRLTGGHFIPNSLFALPPASAARVVASKLSTDAIWPSGSNSSMSKG